MPNAHGPLVNGAGLPSEDPTKVFTVNAQEGKSGAERSISYTNCRFIGHGSFGVVLSANLRGQDGTLGEAIAIKKVLQDPMFMNRELKMMRIVSHPNLVELKSFFYADGDKKGEVYLNLVMEHLPVTLADASKHYTRQKQIMPTLEIKLYMYQLFRSLNYIHALSICHRDIKPHNVLVNPATGVLKLIDFGSAKVLAPGAKSVSYICSRYYRAPELIFGATVYTTMIDIWSTACVMGELMLGQLLFPGESGIDQLVEIIKVLGTPSKAQIITMNEHYKDHKFPQIKAHPLNKVFRPRTAPDSIDLISHLLQYTPTARLSAVQAMCHPFFDELKVKGGKGEALDLFAFTREELSTQPDLIPKLVPDFARGSLKGVDLNSFTPLSFDAMRVSLD